MRLKNIYNSLYKVLADLNRVSCHLYFVVMDGTLITLHDTTCNKLIYSHSTDDVEKFIMQLSGLKDAWRHHNLLRMTKNPNYVNMDYIRKIQKIYGS